MDKEFIDMLYHKLRELSLTNDLQQKQAVQGITNHLTTTGDYAGLLRFLAYYGENYLLEPAFAALGQSFVHPARIVEFGAGLGWLGRGLAQEFGNLPTLFVDKRQWTLIDIVADLESKNGRARVLDELKKGDLIVMSEFLHCLEDPAAMLRAFRQWPMLVIEYDSEVADMRHSYNAQIEKYGAKPLGSTFKSSGMFSSFSTRAYKCEPYSIFVLKPL